MLPPAVTPKNLARLTGSYRFGNNLVIDVWEQDGELMLRPRGEIWFFDLLDTPIRLTAASDSDFYVHSQYRMRLSLACLRTVR